MKKVPFLDLSVKDPELSTLLSRIRAALESGILVNGPEVERFEQAVAHRAGTRYAVGVSSGTDALFLALTSIGIGRGDEVITTSLSWIATANAIAMTGAAPIFADIDWDLNICPDSVERLITPRTKAVVAVDFAGLLCDYYRLREVCEKHGIHLIQDASQAFGATRGRFTFGNGGHISAVSHNVMKVLGALGDAGSIFTDDVDLRDSFRALRYNGMIDNENCVRPSLNFRLDSLQASILNDRLQTVSDVVSRRNNNATFYYKYLPKTVKAPSVPYNASHSFYAFVVLAEDRCRLASWLGERQIEVRVQYKKLMCDHPVYSLCVRDTTVADQVKKMVLSLPIHEKLEDYDLNRVIETISEFYA